MATCEQLLTDIKTYLNTINIRDGQNWSESWGSRLLINDVKSNTASIASKLDTLNGKTFVNDLTSVRNLLNDIRSNTASSGNTTIDLTTLESYGQHELSKLDTIMQTLGHIKTQMNTSTQNQVSIYDQLVLLTQKQASNDHMIRILNHLSLKITGTEVE